MNSNISSALFGAIIVILLCLPIFLLNRNKRKNRRKNLKKLSDLAASNGGKIDKHELFNHFAIGIDKDKKCLYYCPIDENEGDNKIFDLTQFKNSRIVRRTSTSRSDDGTEQMIDHLALGLIPLSKKSQEIQLEFYNSDQSMRLSGELQSLQEWSERINKMLK